MLIATDIPITMREVIDYLDRAESLEHFALILTQHAWRAGAVAGQITQPRDRTIDLMEEVEELKAQLEDVREAVK